MSKTLILKEDVPQYIRDIVSRLHLTTDYAETDIPGYTFKLYGNWRVGYESQLQSDCEKLIAWCKRYYADAYVASTHFWWEDVPHSANSCGGDKWHKAKAYRDGYRNYIKVIIADPVAYRFEKDGYYREAA